MCATKHLVADILDSGCWLADAQSSSRIQAELASLACAKLGAALATRLFRAETVVEPAELIVATTTSDSVRRAYFTPTSDPIPGVERDLSTRILLSVRARNNNHYVRDQDFS